MTGEDDLLPESAVEGLIPTLNKTGWMTEKPDSCSKAFAAYAGEIGAGGDLESLDIGCAYGVATLPALAAGARILACDMEQRHLDILSKRVPAKQHERFRCQTASLPDSDFPAGAFGAILASRVLHFLNGPDIETTVSKMYDWLLPGGRLFLVADTPYTGPWYTQADEYERKKAAGDPWPGYVDDYVGLLPEGTDPEGHPTFINPLDPDILARVCTEAGFTVESAEFLGAAASYAKGNEHAAVIAKRP